MDDLTYGEDFHLARLQPEFTRLCAVIGYRIKDTIGWAPWSRLVNLYQWKKVLRAVEQCSPGDRWPASAERYCRAYAKDEQDATATPPPPRPPPSPKAAKEAGLAFATILRQKGLRP